ncbi:MAG TPA: TVP38/TMEM64 family protein [Alphaproteobacteria bacterium]|nr:TVP38/TMEM64 family protein [Alphaproteobacteria bacterium]
MRRETRPERAMPPSKPPASRWIPLAVLVIGLAAFFVLGGPHYLKFETLRAHDEELRRFAEANAILAVLAFMSVYAAVTAFSLPGGAIMTVFGGYLFGAYLGTVFVVISATAGATVLFLAARTSLGAYLEAKASPFLEKMNAGFQKNALSYLLVLRLVPLFPFWLVNLVPAFLGVSLRTYVLGTFLGIIPGSFVYALVGGGIGELLASGQEPELDILFRPSILLPLVGLALLALIPLVYKNVKARRR